MQACTAVQSSPRYATSPRMECTLHAMRQPGGGRLAVSGQASCSVCCVRVALPCCGAVLCMTALEWLIWHACHRCRQMMQRPDGSHSALSLWAAGGLAGAVSWFSVYPFDVLKTRTQAAAAASSPYKGGWASQLDVGIQAECPSTCSTRLGRVQCCICCWGCQLTNLPHASPHHI